MHPKLIVQDLSKKCPISIRTTKIASWCNLTILFAPRHLAGERGTFLQGETAEYIKAQTSVWMWVGGFYDSNTYKRSLDVDILSYISLTVIQPCCQHLLKRSGDFFVTESAVLLCNQWRSLVMAQNLLLGLHTSFSGKGECHLTMWHYKRSKDEATVKATLRVLLKAAIKCSPFK